MAHLGSKRSVFITYHDEDHTEAEFFIDLFAQKKGILKLEDRRVSPSDEFISNPSRGYVLKQVRTQCLKMSAVTIVLVGKCTHGLRFIDWEIAASLTPFRGAPSGLIGLILNRAQGNALLPPRLGANWAPGNANCYARVHKIPSVQHELREMIEDAYAAREQRAHLISNDAPLPKQNRKCAECGTVHR